MGNLFDRGGLQQDTGLISERWGQEGSEPVNISVNRDSDGTVYTVTAGKTLYIKSMLVSNRTGTAGSYVLKDGGSGGTQRVAHQMTNVVGTGDPMTFDSPLIFETDIYFDEDATGVSIYLTLTGWEE